MTYGEYFLYRCFDELGVLLYVGQSINPLGRLRESCGRFPVRRITLELFSSKDAVLTAEREAIRAEEPRYNLSMGIRSTAIRHDGRFDRVAYQREYMRKRRAALKDSKPSP